MSKNAGTTGTGTTDNATVTKLAKGLKLATFEGSIDQTPEEKDKTKKKILKFKYDRIVFPWSRTGKDVEDKDVTGSVPSLSEVLAYCSKAGFTTEFVVKDGQEAPDNDATVVGFLVDGLNRYLNQTARVKAENTPDAAKAAAISVFAKKMGISLTDAEKMLSAAFGV